MKTENDVRRRISAVDVEIARLESTVETLLDRIAGYKNRIKELEAALPEQKKECRIIKMYHRT